MVSAIRKVFQVIVPSAMSPALAPGHGPQREETFNSLISSEALKKGWKISPLAKGHSDPSSQHIPSARGPSLAHMSPQSQAARSRFSPFPSTPEHDTSSFRTRTSHLGIARVPSLPPQAPTATFDPHAKPSMYEQDPAQPMNAPHDRRGEV